jgi:hypothetical protein
MGDFETTKNYSNLSRMLNNQSGRNHYDISYIRNDEISNNLDLSKVAIKMMSHQSGKNFYEDCDNCDKKIDKSTRMVCGGCDREYCKECFFLRKCCEHNDDQCNCVLI